MNEIDAALNRVIKVKIRGKETNVLPNADLTLHIKVLHDHTTGDVVQSLDDHHAYVEATCKKCGVSLGFVKTNSLKTGPGRYCLDHRRDRRISIKQELEQDSFDSFQAAKKAYRAKNRNQ